MISLVDFHEILQACFVALDQHFVRILENSEKWLHSYKNLKIFEKLAMSPKFQNGFKRPKRLNIYYIEVGEQY